MTRASRTRSWVWKVSNKQPGLVMICVVIYFSSNTSMAIRVITDIASLVHRSLLGYNASDSDSDSDSGELKGDS